jgi:uncharacterized protein involved in exopolysaccharide biosynthesis
MTVRDYHLEFEQESAEEGEGFDFEKFKELSGFIARAPSRRPKLAAAVFAVVGGLGLGLALAMPSTYNSQAKLLAQPDLVLPALGNPGRQVPRDADDPTKNVAEMILRRENIVALAKDADLVDRFESGRPTAARLKDRIVAALRGPKTEQEKLRAIVGTLEKKIAVTSEANTVTLSVDWGEPEMAFDLVTLVQKNFLEARYDSDVAVISDAIAMLQEHAKSELVQVDAALDEYEKARAEDVKNSPPRMTSVASVATPGAGPRFATAGRSVAAAPVAAGPASAAESDAARALEEKRIQIRGIEGDRQRQVDAVSQQLATAQLTLTPLHPTVVALQQKLEALRQPSTELEQLKTEERSLMARIAPASAAAAAAVVASAGKAPTDVGAAAPAGPTAPAAEANQSFPTSNEYESPAAQLAKSKLQGAIERYQNIQARIDSAKIELDITRTAFKYRYTVITPAELPKSPKKPIAQLLGLAALPFAGILAFLLAAALDLASGVFLETWQVARRLKVEVLGELELPR